MLRPLPSTLPVYVVKYARKVVRVSFRNFVKGRGMKELIKTMWYDVYALHCVNSLKRRLKALETLALFHTQEIYDH